MLRCITQRAQPSPQRPPRRPLLPPRSRLRALRVHPFLPSDPPRPASRCSPPNLRSSARSKLFVTSDDGPPPRAGPVPSSSTPISPAKPPRPKPRTGRPQTTRAAAHMTAISRAAPWRPTTILSISSGFPPEFIQSSHRRSFGNFSKNMRDPTALLRLALSVRIQSGP